MPSRTIHLPQAAVNALEQIYASLPSIACKRLCHESCGPIGMSRVEWDRIRKRAGRAPDVGAGLGCSMLDLAGTACTVYAVRPLICRLWGLTRHMACPHGCKPERWLSEEEAAELLIQADRIGGGNVMVLSDGMVRAIRATRDRI